ncbi:hypothetical protein BC828DRAFT_390568 [Blastocladiella britannica]|nr:hypothetical protein BC828DRAFT_390568 [Blastocladiella britannica]
MLNTRIPFGYSSSSILLGPTIALRLQALYFAWKLHRSTSSRFHKSLISITVLRIIDNTLNCTEFNVDWSIGLPLVVLQCIVEWMAGVTLPILNAIRLRAVCEKNWKHSVKVLLGLVGVSILMLTGVTLILIVAYLTGNSTAFGYAFYAGWSLFDSILATLISALFLIELQSATGGRRDLQLVLTEVKFVLISDVITMLACNVLEIAAPTVDPLWALYNLCDAFRVFMFIKFLASLNFLMKRRAPSTFGHGSSKGSSTARPIGAVVSKSIAAHPH